MEPFYEILAPLLVGFTVTKVEKGSGREGDPAKITCVKGDITRSFEVWGGIYGPAVSRIQESTGARPATWLDVGQMFDNITDHVLDIYTNQDIQVTIIAVDDVMTRRLGFRCVETGVEWWVGLTAVKGSNFVKKFSTVEGRNNLAACLTNCGVGLHSVG